jgi:hypothetical protein
MSIVARYDADGARSGPSIARANADHSRQREVWITGRHHEVERRRVLRAVDAFLDTVEEINLSGRGREPDPLMRHRLRRLEVEVGERLPDMVRRAPNGHRLHEALLDWEDELLDDANPSRAMYRTMSDEMAGRWAL